MCVEMGIPLMHQPMDPLCKELLGRLLEFSQTCEHVSFEEPSYI
jgi:hypothetical protein